MTRTRLKRAVVDAVQPAPQWADIVGRTFGRLYVVGYTGRRTRHKQRMVTCRCECGFYVDVMRAHLTSGNTTSCGCAHSEQIAARNVVAAKHGQTRGTRAAGTKVSPLYRSWNAIKTRCFNERSEPYKDYGGRGITMHEAWRNSFTRFCEDVEREIGLKPSRLYSIDRIDNDGHYEPGNIRWATPTEQNRNQRTTKRYELNGDVRTLGEWAEAAGVRRNLVEDRVHRYGWPLDEAIGTPPGFGRCPLADRVKWTSTEAYARYRASCAP